MSRWQDVFHEKVESEYKERVLAAANEELSKLKTQPNFFIKYWHYLSGALSVLSLVYFVNHFSSAPAPKEFLDFANSEDQALLADLDLYEDLDVIDAINDKVLEGNL